MINKAVLYSRFSPGARQNCQSAEAQLERCRAYCKFREFEVEAEFSDEWLSGKDTERPGFQEAMDLVCKIKGVLVVYSLSRFGRSTKDMILCLDRLEKAKAKLVSTTENIEGDDPMGRFTRTLLAAIDEMERERGAIRTSIAMRSYQAAGRRMGAKLPFGYMTDPANPALMVDCEYEKDIISEILRMSSAGYSYRHISKDLWVNGFIGRREPKFQMKQAEHGTGRKTTRTDRIIAWSIGIITPGLICTILKRVGR